jgi:hypothetical protein
MMTSIVPSPRPSTTFACSDAVRKRLGGDADREVGEAIAERPRVLFGEDRRGNEHRHLPAGLNRLERGANRDLGLSITNVADQQPIHRLRSLEVALHVVSRLALVGRILEQERRLELLLPRSVGHVRRARGQASSRVELQELLRHLVDGGLRAITLLLPAAAAELVKARWRRVVAGRWRRAISLDLVEAIQRDVQPVAALVFDHGDFHHALAHEDLLDAAVDPDAVLEVDDKVAGPEASDGFEGDAGAVATSAAQSTIAAEDLVVG